MKLTRKDLIFFITLAAGIALVFGKAVWFGADMPDDVMYACRSQQLTLTWHNICYWWKPVIGLWSPLTGYSFMLDQLIWGADKIITGAHLTNIILHFLAACGFYMCCRLMRFPAAAAGLAVLFWALHPQRPESVVWIAERKDVLILCMGLWCLYLFMLGKKRGSILLFALSGVLLATSFTVKPAVIGIPAIMTAYLWGRYRSKNILFYLKYTGAYWLMSFLCFALFSLLGSTPGFGNTSSLGSLFAVTGWRFGNYLFKTFVPVGLNPFYPHFSMTDSSLLPLFAAGLLGVILLLLLLRGSRQALYLYLPLFISFSAAVTPVLTKIGEVDFADRYSYFPSVFAVVAAAAGICTLANRLHCRKLIAVACASIVLATGYYGYRMIFVWETEESHLAAALNSSKPNFRMLIVQAVQHLHKKDFKTVYEAVERLNTGYMDGPEYQVRTIQIFSASIDGLILMQQGKVQQAMAVLEQVLYSKYWELLTNTTYGYPCLVLRTIALTYQKQGKHRQAANVYKLIALQYQQRSQFEYEFYSALSALCKQDKAGAIRHFENALRYSPDDRNVRANLENLKKSR